MLRRNLILGPSGDVGKAMKFMEMPQVSPDAWKFIQSALASAENISGADAQMVASGNGKKPAPGWGDEDEKKKSAATEALTAEEISALREVLRRHGYNSETGTF